MVSHPKDHGIKLPIIEELLMILSTMSVRGLPCFSKALFASWVLEERREGLLSRLNQGH
jgi:hypothetical protein